MTERLLKGGHDAIEGSFARPRAGDPGSGAATSYAKGSDLYLNHFLEDGSYAAIQVESFEVRETQLANTEAALF
jgi:hypothetical protein